MYKQVIVANKGLNMSPGKLAAMVAHGSVSFLCQWLRRNVATDVSSFTEYVIKPTARIDRELFTQWISGSFTKIILEVENTEEMKKIIEKAHTYGFINTVDFFNIVDESTEFEDIPQWAVIAFAPMEAERIDPITGDLMLYGHDMSVVKRDTKNMTNEEFEKYLESELDKASAKLDKNDGGNNMQAQRYYKEIGTNKDYLCTAVADGIAVMTPVDGGNAEAMNIQECTLRFNLINN